MTTEFFQYAIRTFPGINDSPTEPTAQKAGNGAHLISQYNNFLEATRISVNDLEEKVGATPSGKARIIYENASIVGGDRVVVADYSGSDVTLSVPSGGNSVGSEITLLHVNPGKKVRIVQAESDFIKYKGSNVSEISFTVAYEFVSLIYVGFVSSTNQFVGWIPNKDSLFSSIAYTFPME